MTAAVTAAVKRLVGEADAQAEITRKHGDQGWALFDRWYGRGPYQRTLVDQFLALSGAEISEYRVRDRGPVVTAPVKVRVTLTVTVDPHLWNDEYGTGADPSEVAADVKRYVTNSVHALTGIEATAAQVVAR